MSARSWEAVKPDMNSSVMFSSEELNLMSGFLSISSTYDSMMSDSVKICEQFEFSAEDIRILSLRIRVLYPEIFECYQDSLVYLCSDLLVF